MSTKFPTSVYAEMTPNPATMKFVADRPIIDTGIAVEYLNKSEAKNSSVLAEMLFNFPFVTGVFITSNFVTITKNESLGWDYINFELREFIRDYLLINEMAVQKLPELKEQTTPKKEKGVVTVLDHSELSEDAKKIIGLLDEYVKPAVEGDGGAIDFRSYKDGIVTLLLRGSCSGCPSSVITLKDGIENLLKSQMPDVKEVVAEAG
jgi:NFU1 iron-sulfur cluster scaffold homolog, mitochondrial